MKCATSCNTRQSSLPTVKSNTLSSGETCDSRDGPIHISRGKTTPVYVTSDRRQVKGSENTQRGKVKVTAKPKTANAIPAAHHQQRTVAKRETYIVSKDIQHMYTTTQEEGHMSSNASGRCNMGDGR